MAKSLSYFMREEAKQEPVIKVPGPDTIKDENGNVVELEIKKLSNATVSKINEMYVTKTLLKDKKGNFVLQNGVAAYKVERDREKAARHLMVEALVYPDLKDKKLMEFFNCVDVTDMPLKVFPDSKEYAYVSRAIMKVLNIGDADDEDESNDKEIEDAKNS
jgi:hypothetical protein